MCLQDNIKCWFILFSYQAAAAMCVRMGSFSDPPNAQGLAHFLGLKNPTLAGFLFWSYILDF